MRDKESDLSKIVGLLKDSTIGILPGSSFYLVLREVKAGKWDRRYNPNPYAFALALEVVKLSVFGFFYYESKH